MIIYTSVPLEWVFAGYDSFQPEHEEIVHEGVQMVVEPCGAYQAKIVRLLSPNPQDYLNASLSPGSIIYFRSDTNVE
ncbi:YlzJ-like family protein [Bacillus horti]|uniref:Uncharacterized protein n=1 Tax=Caldalkalibacillus horti TaxID=77523 RepID=A0ABT9VUX1_9BACI|nr:YlzJ-like family protein [Bacillus horti]MDQ0164784.1 hypothetical protein [Bacillus horti]